MKIYTKEELEGMPAGELNDILGEMGTECRDLSTAPPWPHRDYTEEEDDGDTAFGGCLVAVNLSDPTVRETIANMLAASCTHGSLPATNIIIMDIEGGDQRVKYARIYVYTLDSYKEKCRRYLESTRAELLNRLSHLDEVMGSMTDKVVGTVESFAAECEANTDKSTETI